MAYKITPARSNKKKEEESYSGSSLHTTATQSADITRRLSPARESTVSPARQARTSTTAQPKSVRRDFNNGLFSLVDGYSTGIRMARQSGTYDSNKWDDQYKKIKGFLDDNKEQIGSNYYNALIEKMNVTRKGANSLPAYGGTIDRSRPVFEQPKSGSKEDALKYVNRATGASTPQTVRQHQNMALAKNTYDYLAGGGSTDAFSYADLKDYQQMAPKVSDYYNKLTEAWNARNSGEQTVGNLQLTADEAQRNAEDQIRKRNNYPDYWSFDNFTDEEKQEVNDARAAAESGYTVQKPKTMPSQWTMTGNINTANEMIGREMENRDFQKKYAQLTYNDDFAENSRYQRKFLDQQDVVLGGQDARKNAELLTSLYGDDSYMKKYNDIYYEAVNGNQDAMYFLRNVKNPNTGEVNYSADSFVEEYMNDYEREIFNYTFATQGADAAREYVDGIRYDLTKRAFYAADEEFRERLKNADLVSLGLANLASVPLNLAQGAANFLGQSAEMIMGRQVNPYSYENTAGTIRDVTEQKIVTAVEEAGGGDFAKTLASMGYNAFMSGLDSSLSIALGSGVAETLGLAGGVADSVTKYVSLGLMSSGAASNTLNNELMMGIPQGRAALDSMTAGLIEFATERIGMDNLFNNIINGRGNFMSYMKQVLAEGAEELVGDVTTDAINQLYDIIGNTSYSELNRQANAYWLENGMAPNQRNEAMAHVLLDRLQEYAIDTAVGSLSVITGEGSIGAIANFNNAKALTSHLDASVAQDVIQEGLTLDPNSRAYRGAMALQERMMSEFNPVAITPKDVQKVARDIVYEVQGIENDTDRKQAEQDMFKAFGIDRFLHPDVQTTTEQPRTTNNPDAGEFEVNRAEDDAVKAAQDAEQKRIDDSTINSIINEATSNNPTVNPDEIARRVHNVTEQDSADDLSDVLTPEQVQTVAEIASRNGAAQAVQNAMDAIAEKSVPVRQEEATEETVQDTIEEEPVTEQEQPSMEVDTSGFANTLTPAARQVYEQTLEEARQNGMNAADATQAFLEVYTAGTHRLPYAPSRNNQRLSGATRAMISQTAQRESTEYTTKLEQKGFARSAAAGTKVQTSKGLVATPVLARAVQDGRISQRTADVMNKLGQMLGVRINVLSTNPKYNGEYKAQQADINLYLDAKFFNSKTTDEAVIGVLGHELSHRLEDISPEAYRQLTTMVMQTMGSSGFARMVEHNMRLAPGMTILDAQGEVVSDFVGTMLFRDSDFADRFLGNVQVQTAEQRTALQGLRDFVHKVIDWIRGNRDAFKQPEKTITYMEKLENTLTNLINQSAESVKVKGTIVNEEQLGEKIEEANDFRMSRKYYDQHLKDLTSKYDGKESMVSLNEIKDRYAKVIEIWDQLGGELNSQFLNDWNNKEGKDRVFTVFKAQSGYKYNVELASMCKKGVPLFEAIDTIVKKEVMRQLNTDVLGKEEKEILYDILKDPKYGGQFDIPCAICYVEQARQREGQIIHQFINGNEEGKIGWNQALQDIERRMHEKGSDYTFPRMDRSIATDAYVPADNSMDAATQDVFFAALTDATNEFIDKWNKENPKKAPKQRLTEGTPEEVEKKLTGSLHLNFVLYKALFTEPQSRALLDEDLLYSSLTTHNLAKDHNRLYTLFNQQGGTGGYKTKQSTVVYWGDLLQKKYNPAEVRKEGGIRNQSNSDFQMYTFLDQAQMYLDFTAKGYYLQAYTKSLQELKLFGKSRAKINASLIPAVYEYRDANGNVDMEKTQENAGLDRYGNPMYDDIEGIPHEEAFMLIEDSEYSKNICGICIGYSDKHINRLLDDPRVQQIIGFHDKTDDPNKRYRGARYAHNYNGENEATKNGSTVHVAFNEFVIRSEKMFDGGKKSVQFNGKTYSYDNIPELAADMYLDVYDGPGYTPAYPQFKNHPNYYKLLADFGLKDSEGHYAPHQKVEFNLPDTVPYLENGIKKDMSTRDYIKKELGSELTVRDNIAAALADTGENGIIPEFVKRVNDLHKNDGNTRHSVKDADYLAAVNAGDMDTAQRMVDEAAKEAGYVLSTFHGTGEYFNVFRMGAEGIHLGNEAQANQVANIRYEMRSEMSTYKWEDIRRDVGRMNAEQRRSLVNAAYGLGDYYETNPNSITYFPYDGDINDVSAVTRYVDEAASGYQNATDTDSTQFRMRTYDRNTGRNVMHLYAKISNPFTVNGDVVEWTPGGIADVLIKRNNGEDTIKPWYKDEPINISGSNIKLNEEDYSTVLQISEGKVRGDAAWNAIEAVLSNYGYDGIKYLNQYEGDKNSYSYIALNPSDVKLADPVTYDEDGRVIPLSERFNTENPDIRYSLKDNPNAQVGININDSSQAFTDQILDGLKTIETRNTPSLRPYVGQRVALVRTGKGRATVVGYATISEEIRYQDANSFYADRDKHLVDRGSRYSFENSTSGEKYGYALTDVKREDNPYVVTEKGNVARDVDRNAQVRYSTKDAEEIERIKAKKRTNAQDRIILRDAGEKLSEKDFYSLYHAHKLDLRKNGNVDEQVESIKANGFRGDAGFGHNVVPSSINNINRYTVDERRTFLKEVGLSDADIEESIERQRKNPGAGVWSGDVYFPSVNATALRYGARKGDTVMFVPEHYVERGERVINGFKPFDYEVVKVERDFQPYYELYSKAYDAATETMDNRHSLRSEEALDSIRSIVERNQQREQTRMFLDASAEWRQSQTRLDVRKLRSSTDAMLKTYGDKLTRDQKEKLFQSISSLAYDVLRKNGEVFDIEQKATKIAGDIVFQAAGVDDKASRAVMMNDAKTEEAIDYLTNYILASIVSTQTYQGKKLQEQIERNAKLKDTLREVRQKRDAKIRADIEHRKQQRAVKTDSALRKSILARAKRLKNMKMGQAGKALLQQLIGDMNTDVSHLTEGKIAKIDEVNAWLATQDENNINLSESTKKLLSLANQKYLDDIIAKGDIEKLRQLNEALAELEHMVRNQNRLIAENDNRDLREIAYEEADIINNSAGTKEGLFRKIDSVIVQGTLSPMRFVRRLTGYNEKSALYRLAKAIDEGTLKQQDYQMRASKLFDKWMRDRNLTRKWAGKKADIITYDVVTFDGKQKQIQMTPAMRMTLYLASQDAGWMRHMVGADGPDGHIDGAGIHMPNMNSYKKGDMAAAYSAQPDDSHKFRVTKAFLNKIAADLTDEERAFADAAQKFFNGMQKEEINAVSNELVGRDLAVVDNYLPIDVDKNFTGVDYGAIQNDGTVTGIGNLKERQNSGAPVYVRDLTDILIKSINSTSAYVGLAIPIRNMNKLLGVNLGSMMDNGQYLTHETSLNEAIDKKWGQTAKDYINKMLADIQHPVRVQEDLEKAFAKLRSNYARSVLTLNLSVGLKQAASYPTAAAVVGWEPLAKALKDVSKVDLDLIAKYTPLLWYRSRGFINPDLEGIKNQNDFFSNLPKGLDWITGVDFLTTRKLWKAAEYYVRNNQPNLYHKGAGIYGQTDAYNEAVAEVYNRIIEETQPNYTPWQRPQYLRSNSGIVRTLMMFKTQPLQNFNILYDAVGNFKAKQRAMKANGSDPQVQAQFKDASRNLRRAVTSQIGQLITFAAMTMLWNMFRRKEEKYEDEEGNFSIETMLKSMGKDIGSGIFGMVPFGADAWSLISSLAFGDKYYGFESVTDSALGDLGSAFKTTWDTISKMVTSGEPFDITTYKKKIKTVGTAVAKIFGIPAENIYNLFTALYMRGRDLTENQYMADYYALAWTEDPAQNKKQFVEIAWQAYNNGDMEAYEEVKDILVTDLGFSDDTINDNMKKFYAAQYATIPGDTKLANGYRHLYELYKTDKEAFEAEYNKMLDIGFTEEAIKDGVETQMKAEAGVKSVSDLEERFATPGTKAETKKPEITKPSASRPQTPEPEPEPEPEETKPKRKLVSATEGPKKQSDKKKTEPQDGTLNSSWLGGYHYSNGTLQLQVNGAWYTYNNVPEEVFQGLLDAPSAGSYFSYNIKGRY